MTNVGRRRMVGRIKRVWPGVAGDGVGRFIRPTLLLLAAVALAPIAAHAQTSDLVSGGTTTVAAAGLSIEATNLWVENPGYRPLRVTIRSLGPTLADRNLTIVVKARAWWGNQNRVTVEEDVTLSAGATVVGRTIPIPYALSVNNSTIVVLEDGVPLKTPHPILLSGAQSPWQLNAGDRFPRVLFVGDQPPDTSALGQYYGAAAYYSNAQSGYYGPVMGGPTTATPTSPGKVAAPPLPSQFSLPEAKLPTRWIDYTCFDVVCLSLDQLQNLQQKNPDAARAVLAWTQAGGTLWVFATGDGGARLGELDRSLSLASSSSASAWEKSPKSSFGRCPKWIQWDSSGKMVTVGGQYGNSTSYDNQDEIKTLWAWSRKAPAAPAESLFCFRDLGFGQVFAIASERPFPGDPWQWAWIAQTMGNRATWSNRYGIDYGDTHDEFWNFLVPGVGLAPVVEFQVLISVFVLVIGPVNYIVMRRWKRLHLLVLTIPAGALVVTGALFGYALVADGLDVKVRARSVTRIDQRRGQAVCWARLSYYAGLAPYGGLRFSDDVAVLPYRAETEMSNKSQRFVVWNDGQELTRGWLASRTPTQYFTIRSRPTERGLDIKLVDGGATELAIENCLGTPIETLVVRAHDGKYYWATGLNAAAIGQARPIAETEVTSRLRRILAANEPAYPPGVGANSSSYHGLFGIHSYPSFGNQSAVSPKASLMELSLDAARVPGRIEPGSYVAVVRAQPELELGTPGTVETGSFHVVLGEW